jgi:hypothetical protein
VRVSPHTVYIIYQSPTESLHLGSVRGFREAAKGAKTTPLGRPRHLNLFTHRKRSQTKGYTRIRNIAYSDIPEPRGPHR